MNHGFSSTLNDAVYHYHSVYDSELWEETYADPGFHRHVRSYLSICFQQLFTLASFLGCRR